MIKRTTLAASVSVLAMLSANIASADAMADLEAAAKAEGMLTTIALPHDWCGYGAVIDGFKAKYPEITVNELNPDAGSADEIEAIKANKDNTGPQAPDVIDVGLSFGPSAKAEGLTQPYKVATWDEIPDRHQGRRRPLVWRLLRRDVVPGEQGSGRKRADDWADLLKPEYAGQVALAGDPRASNQAILGVLAAGMASGAAPGEAAGEAGLEFFKELNEAGNFVPVIGKAGTLAQGTTPIIVDVGLQRAGRARHAGRQPAGRSRRAEVGRSGGCLCAGDLGLCAASERRQAVDGIPLFGRRSAWLAEGLLPPGPLQRHGRGRQDSARAAGRAAPGRRLCQAPIFPTLEEVDANKTAVTDGWDAIVGANVE